jgi:hypothetical protein
MKLPSFQFYPADWRKDPGVQSLTFHQRGVWLEILCLMHESPRRGLLLMPNGNTMSDDALSRVIGLDKQNLTTTLTAILECGVADREPETGALMNRRMIRDEELRQTRARCGKMGGNPNLLNQSSKQKTTTRLKQKPTPSSSSSSSDEWAALPPELNTEAFKKAWGAYLAYRREAKIKAIKPTSIAAQWKTLAEWGEPAAIESIEETIRNSWQGLFPPKGGNHAKHGKAGKGSGLNAANANADTTGY